VVHDRLVTCTVTDGDAFARTFAVDDFRRHCLINGLDDNGLTLKHESANTAYEQQFAR